MNEREKKLSYRRTYRSLVPENLPENLAQRSPPHGGMEEPKEKEVGRDEFLATLFDFFI